VLELQRFQRLAGGCEQLSSTDVFAFP